MNVTVKEIGLTLHLTLPELSTLLSTRATSCTLILYFDQDFCLLFFKEQKRANAQEDYLNG